MNPKKNISRVISARLTRWTISLAAFDFDIEHVLGRLKRALYSSGGWWMIFSSGLSYVDTCPPYQPYLEPYLEQVWWVRAATLYVMLPVFKPMLEITRRDRKRNSWIRERQE